MAFWLLNQSSGSSSIRSCLDAFALQRGLKQAAQVLAEDEFLIGNGNVCAEDPPDLRAETADSCRCRAAPRPSGPRSGPALPSASRDSGLGCPRARGCPLFPVGEGRRLPRRTRRDRRVTKTHSRRGHSSIARLPRRRRRRRKRASLGRMGDSCDLRSPSGSCTVSTGFCERSSSMLSAIWTSTPRRAATSSRATNRRSSSG